MSEKDLGTQPLDWLRELGEERLRNQTQRILSAADNAEVGTANVGNGSDRPRQSFASNDYLGLAADPRVIDAACRAARRFGWGSGASPLVTGWRTPHQELADALAAFEKTEAVALFSTGYAANLGTIAALVGTEDVVYLDRLNHSCLIQGARLSGAKLRVYRHRDLDHLEGLLRRDRGRFRRSLIATDAVFSMDGVLGPLNELVELSERFGAMFLVDEAHGTGVFGTDGRGAASALDVADRIEIRVGTLSKALGSIGGFVAGSRLLIDHLINHAAPLMFSTALPPAAAAAATEALQLVQTEPWRRQQIHQHADRLREGLRTQGWSVPESSGPIVPVLIGDSGPALQVADRLQSRGCLCPAIRPPTVPRGTARIRISLSALHQEADLSALRDAFNFARTETLQ